jgi:hypothetical protein
MPAQDQVLPTNLGERLKLLLRILQGDRDAMQQFFDCYVAKIREVIRWRLDGRVRSLEDSLDILQEVNLAFLQQPLPATIDSPGALL